MLNKSKKLISLSLAVVLSASMSLPALAGVKLMPDVTP